MTRVNLVQSREKIEKKNNVTYEFYVSERESDPDWDDFVNQAADGHHVQSSLWSQLKQIDGWRPIRLIANRNQEIVAGIQILLKSIPIPFLGTIGYASNGPILDEADIAFQKLFLSKLNEILKTYKIQLLFVQPSINGYDFEKIIIKEGYRINASVKLSPDATVLIDLSSKPDDILKAMKSKTRYNIRYAERNDVEVFEGTKDDLPLFHQLLQLTAQRQGFEPYPLDYFKKLYDLFEAGNYLKILFAKHANQVVSTVLLITYCNTVIYKKGGWSGEKGNLRPNELLHWSAICWAKDNGYRFYDLEGIDYQAAITILNDEPIPSNELDTPTRFKVGFGGDVKLLPRTYTYLPNALFSWGYYQFADRLSKSEFVRRFLRQNSSKTNP